MGGVEEKGGVGAIVSKSNILSYIINIPLMHIKVDLLKGDYIENVGLNFFCYNEIFTNETFEHTLSWTGFRLFSNILLT